MQKDLEKQPSRFGTQHAHLIVGGKSIYFNEQTTKKGTTYLSINALAGDLKQKLTLFENQLAPVIEVLLVIADRWDQWVDVMPEPTLREAGFSCPRCGGDPFVIASKVGEFPVAIQCEDGHAGELRDWASRET